MKVFEVFNNRELSTGFWFFGLFILSLFKKDLRKSYLGLVSSIFNRYILAVFIPMLFYMTLLVYVFWKIRIWDTSFLKDTIFWILISGVALVFRFGTDRSGEQIFRNAILDGLKVAVLLEFLVNLYVFPLYVELFTVPIITFIFLLKAFSENKGEYNELTKVLDGILSAIGILIFGLTVNNVVQNFEDIDLLHVLHSFSLPFMLLLSFFPFLYFQILLFQYEEVKTKLKVACRDNNALRKYALRKIVRYAFLNQRKLNLLLKHHSLDLIKVRDKRDIEEILAKVG